MAVLPLGLRFEHPSASSAKPHILSYATARSVADDSLLEVWNGSTSAARVLRLNKDGQVQLQQGAVGAPVLAPEGDKDTGFYFVTATPEVAVAVAGTKRLSVVAAGVAVTGSVTSSGALLVSANDGAALGVSGTAWSDLFLASGGVINWNAGNVTLTHSSGRLTMSGALSVSGNGPHNIGGTNFDYIACIFDSTFTSGGASTQASGVHFGVDLTGASGDTAALAQIRTGGTITTQANDTVTVVASAYIDEPFITVGSSGTVTNSAALYVVGAATEATNNYAVWVDSGITRLDGQVRVASDVVPHTNDVAALGTSSLMFSDLFLASGAVVNFNNGDMTLTHSANKLTFAGGSVEITGTTTLNGSTSVLSTLAVTGACRPGSNDGSALGASGTAWSDLFLASGAVINWNAADVTLTHSAAALSLSAGKFFIGDTANAQQTVGLTINSGSASNQTLALKSDVAHGLTASHFITNETDTFFFVSQLGSGIGGAILTATSVSGTRTLVLVGEGSGVTTTKSSGFTGLVSVVGVQHDGAGNREEVDADGNVFSVSRGTAIGGNHTLFIIDEDGDFHYDGADGGAFDSEDDVQLVRAFALATSKAVIRTQFDDFVRYNEADLVRMGILGAPVAKGGLVNGAQVQRLLVGAIWQQAQRIEALERRLLSA